jgi:hypothetical protein
VTRYEIALGKEIPVKNTIQESDEDLLNRIKQSIGNLSSKLLYGTINESTHKILARDVGADEVVVLIDQFDPFLVHIHYSFSLRQITVNVRV